MNQFKHFLLFCTVFSLMLFSFVATANAIIIRHDVDANQYLQEEGAYSAVFDIFEQRGGVATLIAPQWAITAAHVGQDIPKNHPVTIGGEQYMIQQSIMHPTWNSESFVDLALLQLDKPVNHVDPIPIYEQDDEKGQIVTFVGRGDTGTGLTGPVTADHQLRAATNLVERAESKNLVFRFDAPTDENVTPLEGISGPGDSGGPALLEKNNTLYIAGISVAQDSAGHERGTYGVWEFYTRISPQAEWIQATILNPPEAVTSETVASETVSPETVSPVARNSRPFITILGLILFILLAISFLWIRRRQEG